MYGSVLQMKKMLRILASAYEESICLSGSIY